MTVRKNRIDFGQSILNSLELSKIPITKEELRERHGEEVVAFQWHFDREIKLKDLLNRMLVDMFHSKEELKCELNKAYRKCKIETF